MGYSTRRAIFATAMFSLAGIVSWFLFVVDWHVSLPLALFYGVLILNTYPSVHLFSSIVPQDDGKHALADVMLAVSYLFLALNLAQPIPFAVSATVMFLIAAGKYTLMLHDIPHPDLLQRKVRIDLLGAFMCSCVLALMVVGYIPIGSWTLAIVFGLANIYVLAVNPLYRL